MGERLWIKPLVVFLMSIGFALFARLADGVHIGDVLPDVSSDSIETLLQILSASMLVIATFAVASMVAAYSAASATATPRSFPLIIADDASQNALSTFIGAFIFSSVALVAIKNGYYEESGRFVLFVLTLILFAVVILTFVGWVDSIARLGRLGSTVKKAEAAANEALEVRRKAPNFGAAVARERSDPGHSVYSDAIGYVQRVDIPELQAHAEQAKVRILLASLPGTFAAPGRALAFVATTADRKEEFDAGPIRSAFTIGPDRTFDEDPRFGLIVLSEIASRALSPAVNDPGTAIDVIGSFVRLFTTWCQPVQDGESENTEVLYPLVEVPELSLDDMLDDAFRAIARDGAGNIEVVLRLQKAFQALATLDNSALRAGAKRQARLAEARAEAALEAPEDIALLRGATRFANVES